MARHQKERLAKRAEPWNSMAKASRYVATPSARLSEQDLGVDLRLRAGLLIVSPWAYAFWELQCVTRHPIGLCGALSAYGWYVPEHAGDLRERHLG